MRKLGPLSPFRWNIHAARRYIVKLIDAEEDNAILSFNRLRELYNELKQIDEHIARIKK